MLKEKFSNLFDTSLMYSDICIDDTKVSVSINVAIQNRATFAKKFWHKTCIAFIANMTERIIA